MRRLLIPLLLIVVVLIGSRLVSDPVNDARGRRPAPDAASQEASDQLGYPVTIERPGQGPSGPNDPRPPPQRIERAALSADAAETIARYAQLTGTWSWRDVVPRMREASRTSLALARYQAATMAAQIPLDPRYRTRQMRQTTRIEAVVAREIGAERATYLVVQRRRIEMRATPPSNGWFITLATLRRYEGRWAVSEWADQP